MAPMARRSAMASAHSSTEPSSRRLGGSRGDLTVISTHSAVAATCRRAFKRCGVHHSPTEGDWSILHQLLYGAVGLFAAIRLRVAPPRFSTSGRRPLRPDTG